MKIAVTANGNDLSAQVNPRFTRCDHFSEASQAIQDIRQKAANVAILSFFLLFGPKKKDGR